MIVSDGAANPNEPKGQRRTHQTMTESSAEGRTTNGRIKHEDQTQRLLTAAAISLLLACCASAQVKDYREIHYPTLPNSASRSRRFSP